MCIFLEGLQEKKQTKTKAGEQIAPTATIYFKITFRQMQKSCSSLRPAGYCSFSDSIQYVDDSCRLCFLKQTFTHLQPLWHKSQQLCWHSHNSLCLWKRAWGLLCDSLSVLKCNHCYFVDDERVFWSDAERLAEETLCQLGVVGQTVLQADVEHRQVTPGREEQRDMKIQDVVILSFI